MNRPKKKVCIALSGGVDSSTAASLLLDKGYECFAIFMITCDSGLHAQDKAQKTADELGIKLHIIDLRQDFERILEYFCNEYQQARTPNPCVQCNRLFKFGKLWDFAKNSQADYIATGHYAKVLTNKQGVGLYAADNPKDQSYALAMIKKDVLNHIILPLGDYTKEQTRALAAKLNLSTAQSKESQEICFIPNDDYAAILEKRCPQLVRKGKITDSAGNILGEHNGLHNFTIGQRRGLRVAMGEPYYVVKLDAQTNTVTLGPKKELMHIKLSASGVNWLIEEPREPFESNVKIRYNNKGQSAIVYPHGKTVEVIFDEPVSAITPGQLAVFYIKENLQNQVAGGGWIDRAWD